MKITKQLCDQFLDYYRNANHKPDTIANYQRDFLEFMDFFIKKWHSDVEEISFVLIQEWRSKLRTTPTPKKSIYYGVKPFLSERTIQCKVQAIKKFLEFTNDIFEIGMDYRRIKVPKVRSQHMDFFEESELSQIKKSIEKSEKYPIARIRAELFAVMAFSSGMRISEMVKIKAKDVFAGQTNIVWKWGKERVVFFTQECKTLLKEYLKLRGKPLPCTKKVAKNTTDEERAFISHHPKTFWQQISVQTLAQHNKKYNKNLHIPWKKYTAHTMRHSFATYLLDQGVNIREIQEMMGHSDLKTTEWYLRIRNNQTKATHANAFKNFWKS